MKKALTFALAFSCLALLLGRPSFAQDSVTRTAVSVAAEGGSRDKDKLIGPVRRVRVETVRILPKNGSWVEGPRELLGIATYEPAGKKIDSVVYPAEQNSPSGKQQYVYDQKGNVVEMTLLSSDGAMLSKESYKYEFDQLGNWTKMASSVAVYENGKVIFEPTGITYRTISYYYSQAIEKLSASSAKSKSTSTASTPATKPTSAVSAPDSSPRPTAKAPVASSQPVSEVANAHAKTEMVIAPASVSPSDSSTSAPESPATLSEIRPTPVNPPPTSVVQYFGEQDLRSAAIELPGPEYSSAALQSRASGKVRVQILVDETGHVTTAQAMSGNPLLKASAEDAARKARFSLAKVTSGATKVYGVLTYEFVPPKLESDPLPEMTPTSETVSLPQPDKRTTETKTVAETAALVESKPKTGSNYLETARTSYDQGVTFQAAGRYAEAAEAFNQTIKTDPNDAKAYARLGMAYSALEKHKDAIVVYKMARQIDDSVLGAPAYYMWGHSYLALEKSSDALSAFKQGLKITRAETNDGEATQRYPSLEQLHYGLAIAYLNSKRFGDSINELKEVLKLNPKHAEAHYTLVVAYLSNGNRKDAETHQKLLTTLNPALAQKLASAMAGISAPPGCLNIACRR